MRHPFDGPGGLPPTRRAILGGLLAGAAGLLGASGARAQATTLAMGEEGGRPPTTLAFGEEGGLPPTTQFLGEEGGVTTFAFGEEGATTYAIGEEGGVTTFALGEEGGLPPPTTLPVIEEGGVVPVPQPLPDHRRPPPAEPLSRDVPPRELETAWNDLGSTLKGAQARQTILSARNAVDFLKDRVKIDVPAGDPAVIEPLIRRLGDANFQSRIRAMAALEDQGPAAEKFLRQALEPPPGRDVRMRIERLLERINQAPDLRQARLGMEILAEIGTRESRGVLEELAGGDSSSWSSAAARQVLGR